jgi:ribosomal protein S18 acetylase RimI-like enzyme
MPALELYRSSDRETLLAIFDANTPRFFAPRERDDFAKFLDQPLGDFRVLYDDQGTTIGCGGVMVDEHGTASLVWGIIAPPHQGTGFGWWMALERLSWIAAMPHARRVVLDTSQETAGFYCKLGFRTLQVHPDGYGPGLHRHDLEMVVDEAYRERFGAGAKPLEREPVMQEGRSTPREPHSTHA